jgi:uncharacterized OsmC-like protein
MSVQVTQIEGGLSEEERMGVLKAAHSCYVGNTLEGIPKINISLTG